MSVLPLASLRARAGRALRRRLAGDDIDGLVAQRDRRRLRWIARDGADPVLRFRALRSLSELLDPDAVELFVSLVEAEPGALPPATVRAAAEGLGRLMHGDAARSLRRLLAPDRPAGVQLAAARALATVGREADWAAVREWARSVAPLTLDGRDCHQLESTPRTAAVQVLEVLYADKELDWWSAKAASWLEADEARPRMKSDAGADRIVAQNHRFALERKDLDDDDFRRIVLHLGTLGRERDQPLLLALVQAQTDHGRRRAAIQALGLHGDPRSIAPFVRWMQEVPPHLPELAKDLARGAGRLGQPELAESLAALAARVPEAAAEVCWALGECNGPDAVRHLVDGIDDEALLPISATALRRCGVPGREAIRGAVAIARAGGGERQRVRRLAELAGVH